MQNIHADWTLLTLPGRHWKWRMRGGAAWFAAEHAAVLAQSFDVLLTTSMLALAELIGLCPALTQVPRLLYFHENQLAYPVREQWSGPRDHHFGFTQLVSALAATRCAFNSEHNRTSFLTGISSLLDALPDAVHPSWIDRIEARSEILGVPLDLPDIKIAEEDDQRSEGPILLWNHRWEHDKNPERLLAALRGARSGGATFRLVVCGRKYREVPEALRTLEREFSDALLHFGYVEDEADYRKLLGRAHIAISTADHEFFGVSMIEATHFGARPLVPDRLSYPELFPEVFRYANDQALVAQLIALCTAWQAGDIDLRQDRQELTRDHRGPSIERWRQRLASLSRESPAYRHQ